MNNQENLNIELPPNQPDKELYSEELIKEIEDFRARQVKELEKRMNQGSKVISREEFQEVIKEYQNKSRDELWDRLCNNFPNRLPGGFDRIVNKIEYVVDRQRKQKILQLYNDIDRLISEQGFSVEEVERLCRNYRRLDVNEKLKIDELIKKLFMALRKLGYSRDDLGI